MTNDLAISYLLHLRGTLLDLGASENDLDLVEYLIEREKNLKKKSEE